MALWECAVDQTITGSQRPVTNIFHVNASAGAFAQPLADMVRDAWVTHILPRASNTLRVDRVRVRDQAGIGFAEAASGAVGGVTTDGSSPQVAVLVRKVVPGLPRRRYGKMYLAGFPESHIDAGGTVQASSLTAWNTSCEAFLQALIAGTAPLAQPTFSGNAVTPPDWTPQEVASLQVQSRVATQKRRMRK